jgi:putative Ca2+/H+ antiporter (TMEM165/GDT1 family)
MEIIQAYFDSMSLNWDKLRFGELDVLFDNLVQLLQSIQIGSLQAILTSASASFALIAAAEMGDKSQLVCMALASKHRPIPVISGALFAFALLNTLAVVFGKAVASWFPEYLIALMVAGLFTVFGIQALRTEAEEPHEEFKEKSGHGIFFTTFLLITVAEFGDKTQLAVVALSSTNNAAGIWLGATLALGMTSTMGVLAGRKLLQKISVELLHKIGGILFLILALVAAIKAGQSYFGFPNPFLL